MTNQPHSSTLLIMSHGQTVARNAAWLMAATVGQKALAFLAFYFIARLSGPAVTGKYFFAVAVTSVFVVITDLGLTPVIIREMAANEERGRALLAQALRAKLFLIPVAILGALAYAIFSRVSHELFLAILLACAVMSADAISLLWYGTMRGRRRLRFEALGMCAGQLITAILGVGSALLWPGNIYALVGALLAGSAWNVIWSRWQARRLGLTPLKTNALPWMSLARAAMPFALAGIFVKVYSYTDTLLLKQFHTAADIGQYAVAYKITYALQFLPLTFVAALYPGLSSAHAADDRVAVRSMFSGSLRLMMLLSAPLAAGLSGFASWLPRVYGASYAPAIAPLSVLAWVLIPIFLDFPIGSLLNATHRAAQKTTAMGIAMIVNVAANALLVPSLGPLGAAWAGVISFSLLFLMGVWFSRHDFPNLAWLLGLLVRGGIAAAVIWMGIRFLMPILSAWQLLLVAFVGTIGVLGLMRLLLLDDLRLLRRWFKRA